MQITRDIPSYFKKQDKYLIVYHRHHNSVRAGNARFMCIDDMPLDENGDVLPIKMTKEWKMEFKDNAGCF
jgi:hypothetical protein